MGDDLESLGAVLERLWRKVEVDGGYDSSDYFYFFEHISRECGILFSLDTHSSSEADPSESSAPLIFVAPMVSPFLCLNDSESDTEIPERHVSPTPHEAMLTRWRSRVALRSSSPTTSILEIPTAPILPEPSAIVTPSSESFIIWHSITGNSFSKHTPPNTTNADSFTPPRFVHPSLARTPRPSEAYLRWRSASLSTMYPPMTSRLSAGDSSSDSSARTSRKRYLSLTTTVTSSIHVMRALVPSRADLLPPRKRFRDSISPEDSVEGDINTDVLKEIKSAIEVAEDRDVEAGVDGGIGMEVNVGVDVKDEVENEVEYSNRGTMEVGVDVVAGINIPDVMLMPDAVKHLKQVEEGQRGLEARSLIAGRDRASLLNQVTSLERSNARLRGTMMIERARADRFQRPVSFMESELRQIRRFRYYDRMRFRRLETFAVRHLGYLLVLAKQNMSITHSGMTPEAIEELVNRYRDEWKINRNGEKGNGGNEKPNENNRDARLVARECTYQDFLKCQPLNFKGTEGVVRLIRWFKKMETVFHISNFPEKDQVKYATCTLLNSALTWWNSHKRTIGAKAAFAMS
ncbi:hypothetical protein Tco_1337918 [Tanacetum coccineum]